MASDRPDSIAKWRRSKDSPVTVTASRFAELVLEQGLRVIGPDSDGYKYAALETENGYDLYRTPDVDWDKIPIKKGLTANPAAGAEVATITVPNTHRWLFYGWHATLVSSADVASRSPALFISLDGTSALWRSTTSTPQTASLTVLWGFCPQGLPGTTGGSLSATGMYVCFGINPVELPPGATIRVGTGGIVAADDWAAATYYYKEAPA